MTKHDLDYFIKKEAAKIDEGKSNLTKENGSQAVQQQGGMSMGEALLSSAAGALLGAWIGSKLFGNQNYQNNRRAGYKSPSTYSRSANSFNKKRTSSSGKSSSRRSGFFGGSSKSGSRSGSFFGG